MLFYYLIIMEVDYKTLYERLLIKHNKLESILNRMVGGNQLIDNINNSSDDNSKIITPISQLTIHDKCINPSIPCLFCSSCLLCSTRQAGTLIARCLECMNYFCNECDLITDEHDTWLCYTCFTLKCKNNWNTENHKYYPKTIKDNIFMFLLLLKRLKTNDKLKIPPKFIKYEIIKLITNDFIRNIPSSCPLTLNVAPYDESINLYINNNNHFKNAIMRVNDNGTLTAIGIKESGIIRELSEQDKITAQRMGVSF